MLPTPVFWLGELGLGLGLGFRVVYSPWGFPGSSDGKAFACSVGDLGSIPGSGDPLEKEMATHSSILAWRIPRTEKPGRLQSTGSPLEYLHCYFFFLKIL